MSTVCAVFSLPCTFSPPFRDRTAHQGPQNTLARRSRLGYRPQPDPPGRGRARPDCPSDPRSRRLVPHPTWLAHGGVPTGRTRIGAAGPDPRDAVSCSGNRVAPCRLVTAHTRARRRARQIRGREHPVLVAASTARSGIVSGRSREAGPAHCPRGVGAQRRKRDRHSENGCGVTVSALLQPLAPVHPVGTAGTMRPPISVTSVSMHRCGFGLGQRQMHVFDGGSRRWKRRTAGGGVTNAAPRMYREPDKPGVGRSCRGD